MEPIFSEKQDPSLHCYPDLQPSAANLYIIGPAEEIIILFCKVQVVKLNTLSKLQQTYKVWLVKSVTRLQQFKQTTYTSVFWGEIVVMYSQDHRQTLMLILIIFIGLVSSNKTGKIMTH